MKYTPKYGGKGAVLTPQDGSPKGKKLKGTEGGKKDPLIKNDELSLDVKSGDRLTYSGSHNGMGVANADGSITISGFTVPVGYKKPKDNLTHAVSDSLRSIKTESANPRMSLFDRYCAQSAIVTRYGAMDYFAKSNQPVPTTSEFVSLMEASSNYSFDQLPSNDDIFIVTAVNGTRLVEHARKFLGVKKRIVESTELSPAQKGDTLTKIYCAMFHNVPDRHMAILPESMTTHMLSMPSGVVGYKPAKIKKHKKRKAVAGNPTGFKSVGNFDQVDVKTESIKVPSSVSKSVAPITRKIAEYKTKLVIDESVENVVYRVYKTDGSDNTQLMSEGSSALSAAIDAFELSGVGGNKSIVEISSYVGDKKIKTTNIVVPPHNKFQPVNGQLFRFEESARLLAPKSRISKHNWGVIAESYDEMSMEEEMDMEGMGSNYDEPCDEESETVEDGIMNLIKSTLAQHCAECCISLEDGSEYDVAFDDNCVTVNYGDGRTDKFCISIENSMDDDDAIDGAEDVTGDSDMGSDDDMLNV